LVDPDIVSASMKFKDKLYAVPFTNAGGLMPWVMAIREDWLANVGITKYPETVEEYHEVLRRFTFDDPDGNGQKDTYGSHGVQLFLRGAFGLGGTGPSVQYYADDNGQVYATVLTESYKNYLKTMQEWYAEGLIDPESI